MNKKKQIGMAILAMLMTASVTAWAANDLMMAIRELLMQTVMW